MENTDVMERTLAREKEQFDRFCKIIHILSTAACVLFACGAVFCMVMPLVRHFGFVRGGGSESTAAVAAAALYTFLLLGGIALLLNYARNIFRRLRAAETPFCYDIADKIKGAGQAAWLIGFGLLVFGAAATLFLNDPQLLRPYGFGTVEFGILVLGAVLAIAAYVFNYGCKLQQESDETL